ncbi:MAG TPA: nitrile hydratase accessory protein [Candidatus Acidoferrum sp.]|jgi:nitrile hydratase accessory protein|nr:nitrile hydratase accessory protein [Candidatus Acidoferrum sp.]
MSNAALNQLIEAARLDPDHVFSAPWEARAFAIALQLSERGHFTWDEFRDRLIAEVGASDRIRARDGTSAPGEYYDHFLHALERLLQEKSIALF